MGFYLLLVLLGFTTAATIAQLDSPQQQTENVDQLIQEAKVLAIEEGTDSNNIYRYISEILLLGKQTSVRPPCFIRERSEQELEPSPQKNYTQLFLEDYQSARDFMMYIQKVEQQYNDTMSNNPNCEYCIKFKNVQQTTEQLVMKLDALVEAIDLTLPISTNQEQSLTTNDEIPEHCTNLCPEQQVDIFLRLDIFASVYLTQDLIGLQEQLKAN